MPTELRATAASRTSALVRWAASEGAVTSELRRETYAKVRVGKKKVLQWTAGQLVGQVPVSVGTSLEDQAGKGTFRYAVRACNESGCSEWSAPVSINLGKR